MNLSEDTPENENRLQALFEAKEAEFQENLYKSWAMAERDSTYEAVKEIAIALINHGSYFDDDFADEVVKDAISIHEEIRKYSDKINKQNNETQLRQQNDSTQSTHQEKHP